VGADIIFLVVLTALTPLLGGYMARVYPGSGLFGVLLLVVLAVFIAGLMVGFIIIFALLNFLAALFIGPLDQALTAHLYP
jgi:K+-transporting ATPase A subunit